MQKLGLQQSLQQKLSPQQIQFIKLLQIPTIELEDRIQEEIAENPALEQVKDDNYDFENSETESEADFSYSENNSPEDYDDENNEYDNETYEQDEANDNMHIDDEYLQAEESYKTQDNNYNTDDEEKNFPIAAGTTFVEFLEMQLGFLKLSDKEQIIGKHIIGTLDNDGYLRRELKAISGDLTLTYYIEVTEKEIEAVLKKIQQFDPPGVAARNLQECLLIQLKRKKYEEVHTDEEKRIIDWAIEIIENNFEEFTKKHYDKIEKRLGLSDEELKSVLKLITKLNPKPGNSSSDSEGASSQQIIPDFIITNNNGKLDITLNARNAPQLRISPSFADMLDTYQKSKRQDKGIKETIAFVKQKLDAAKWFIDAIKQRQQTLLKTMQAIAEHQYDFFLEGDETKLKPMILKDIAEKIGMDISTVSRVVSNKYVQTEFGVYPLKHFFSEGIITNEGEEASSREVKAKLKELVDNEDKRNPLSDEKLEKILKEAGYHIARRTVAKYREQLGIPVARLRKNI